MTNLKFRAAILVCIKISDATCRNRLYLIDVTSVFAQADFLGDSLRKSALISRGKNLSVFDKTEKFPEHKFESI